MCVPCAEKEGFNLSQHGEKLARELKDTRILVRDLAKLSAKLPRQDEDYPIVGSYYQRTRNGVADYIRIEGVYKATPPELPDGWVDYVGSLTETNTDDLTSENWAGVPLWKARHAGGDYRPLASGGMTVEELEKAGWEEVSDVPEVWRLFLNK